MLRVAILLKCFRYRDASMVNSKVSRQWFWDKYAINAVSDHGGGALFESTSAKVGCLGLYGPWGIVTTRGFDVDSSADIVSSSSASQSENVDLLGDDPREE